MDKIRKQATRIRIRAPGPPSKPRGYARVNVSNDGPYIDVPRQDRFAQHEFDAGTDEFSYGYEPYDYDGPEDLAFGVYPRE